MANVDLARVPSFYHNYIRLAGNIELGTALKDHQTNLVPFLKKIPDDKWKYRYAEGKWSVNDIVQHIIDGERIFSYRALRIARNDKTALPGFDENNYAAAASADKRTKQDLIEELAIVQRSSAAMFASFGEQELEREGIANGLPVYVRGIGYIIVGHALHHKNILLERYL